MGSVGKKYGSNLRFVPSRWPKSCLFSTQDGLNISHIGLRHKSNLITLNISQSHIELRYESVFWNLKKKLDLTNPGIFVIFKNQNPQ